MYFSRVSFKKLNDLHLHLAVFFVALFFLSVPLLAAKKAHVVTAKTEVYEFSDFDSSVIRLVDPDEVFLVSDKPTGPFYKVKFKDGKTGYIPDTELFIEGVGEFKPKNYVEDESNKLSKKKNNKAKIEDEAFADDEADAEANASKVHYYGPTITLINYKEKFYGSRQTDDLTALGFRSQPIPSIFDSALAYELNVALKAPKYFAEKTGGSANGGILWATAQISNVLPAFNRNTSFRYGAGPLLRASHVQVKTTSKNYTLQELGLGLDFQAGLMLHSRWLNIDLGLRYMWEKNSYGGLSLAFLF